MKAIVPLNVTALRVSNNDATSVVKAFHGATATFDAMPYRRDSTESSTGDRVERRLDQGNTPQSSLGTGIHLHWELPDYFRRGSQPATGSDMIFPAAPNRYLVIRHLSIFRDGQYGPCASKAWIVESDYLSQDNSTGGRPVIAVPLVPEAGAHQPPFMYMGRVLDYEHFDPASETTTDYLPARQGADGKPLYLTAMGFVGPAFASYYPECCSIFGFWDHFGDVPADVQSHLVANDPIKFQVSYQVIGWVNEAASDPLPKLRGQARDRYADYLKQCDDSNVAPAKAPEDFFIEVARQDFEWDFNRPDITATLQQEPLDGKDAKDRTLCAGVIQGIVWDMLKDSSTRNFLANPDGRAEVWSGEVEIAVGNTVPEALSALLKYDLGDVSSDRDVLANYEFLLDALQLGLLYGLEAESNKIIRLEEALHGKAFGQINGGNLWIIQQKPTDPGSKSDQGDEATLDIELAELLHLLNQAQKDYDQGCAALTMMRKQLFMDWLRYIGPYVQTGTLDNDLANFLSTSDSGELNTVVAMGDKVGVLKFLQDETTREMVGLLQPTQPNSFAAEVWNKKSDLDTALAPYSRLELKTVPAAPFLLPTDPVLLMEGDRVEPVRRNGATSTIAVRLADELISTLSVKIGDATFAIGAGELSGRMIVKPLETGIALQDVVDESYLLIPMLAGGVADALAGKGGANNPAVTARDDFVGSLQTAQGGVSPLDGGTDGGLFAAIRHDGYVAVSNPTQSLTSPLPVSFSFTNASASALPPDAVGWNAQRALPEFGPARYDPFLPVFLVWRAGFDPLRANDGTDYAADNLTRYFTLDADGVDYQYANGNPFTAGSISSYSNWVTLSKRPVFSLTRQIDVYTANYPSDQEADHKLQSVKNAYQQRKIMAQALSGFGDWQILRRLFPKVKVADLIKNDHITKLLDEAATHSSDDNWYDLAFNGEASITAAAFSPLRAGFLQIEELEVVDVFGQRMQLQTKDTKENGPLRTIAAINTQPSIGDSGHQDMIYLPPRLLMPTRLWFRWLSAAHDTNLPDDFVEMNSHPATSPVCGWLVPNHLDNSLQFYDAGGAPIGSFGLEHGAQKYRTRAGRHTIPADDLTQDIGVPGSPTVNPHLARFMHYVDQAGASPDFLTDLMAAILASDNFINPANFAQDTALSVLIGRPLALTRAALALETIGGLLPLNQLGDTEQEPFPQDVKNHRFDYAVRQQFSSGKLDQITFPVRLGELLNMDDGLAGYLIESSDPQPYGDLFSPAADAHWTGAVRHPSPTTVQLTLNASPLELTLLVDPRATIHATTGILPVEALSIPPDQYADALRRLAMSFFTTPLLQKRAGLTVPLPRETGFDWNWITPENTPLLPLKASAADEFAAYSYTPQTLLEGWLSLTPSPSPTDKLKS